MSSCYLMSELNHTPKAFRVASVIARLAAGGIGPVCRYAAEGIAKLTDWRVTLLSLHDPVGEFTDEASGLRISCLGIDKDCAGPFLKWLAANPQDAVVTSDVSHIEASFPFFPKETLHVIQVHDSLRRYRDAAVRNHRWVDGMCCVARHIEEPLRDSLQHHGFRGLAGTVHNGAAFPAPPIRISYSGPLRLLYMGRMDPFKGILDLAPILQRLDKMDVPVRLMMVGGRHELLEQRFKRRKIDHLVTWAGRVPHKTCYRVAADSDVFLMPSRKEPFGMVTIEAMSMGCVPLAYNTPSGSSEIIEQDKSGFLLPLGDFTAWAHAIKSLHENRNQWRRLSEGAMHRARTEFNEERMGAGLCKFIKKVKAHSEIHPPERLPGLPPETPVADVKGQFKYQHLPPRFREWARNTVGSSPRLSWWWLNR
jgi:glycosyltransferase involved in cell wall biosynthesis